MVFAFVFIFTTNVQAQEKSVSERVSTKLDGNSNTVNVALEENAD